MENNRAETDLFGPPGASRGYMGCGIRDRLGKSKRPALEIDAGLACVEERVLHALYARIDLQKRCWKAE